MPKTHKEETPLRTIGNASPLQHKPGEVPRSSTQAVCWAIRISDEEFGDICAQETVDYLTRYGYIGEF